MPGIVEHINPEGMHESPVFSQGIVVSEEARSPCPTPSIEIEATAVLR